MYGKWSGSVITVGGGIGTCRLQRLVGYMVGNVLFRSSTTFSSMSGMFAVGGFTLTARVHPHPLLLGAVCEISRGGNAVDLFLAITAGGSLRILGF